MQPTLAIACGTSAMRVVSNVEEAIKEDLGRIPACFKKLTIDADYSYYPDILLDREAAKNLLRNPSGYRFEIDYSEAKKLLRSLENSDKGALLTRPLGRVLIYVSVDQVVKQLQQVSEALHEGIEKEKERGLPVSNTFLIIVIASPFGGVGSSIPPDIISVAKYLFPNAQVILVTSSQLCSAGTELPLSQFEKARRNCLDLINELIAIKEGKTPTTFYPYLKDGVLNYPNFKIRAAPPDVIFDVRPKTNSLNDIIEGMTYLIRDLVLYGVPLFLEQIENLLANLEGNVISVTTEHYEFPVKQIREWIEEKAFREQLSISIKTEVSRSILAEHMLSRLFEEVM